VFPNHGMRGDSVERVHYGGNHIKAWETILSKKHISIVLQHSTLVHPYINMHKNTLRSENHGKSDAWITKEHMNTFGN
jgi:uridine kinase